MENHESDIFDTADLSFVFNVSSGCPVFVKIDDSSGFEMRSNNFKIIFDDCNSLSQQKCV